MALELFGLTVNVLHKSLDLRQQRQSILNSNIANAETPGFVAKDVKFEEALRRAARPATPGSLQGTHSQHFPSTVNRLEELRGDVVATASGDVGRDLNTVSMDQEMASLTTNSLQYNTAAEVLSRLFSSLQRVINEGRP